MTPEKRQFFLRIGFALVTTVLVSGVINNFAAWEPVFVDVDVFGSVCRTAAHNSSSVSLPSTPHHREACPEQAYLLNLTFFILFGGLNVVGLVTGTYFDKVPRRVSVITAAVLYFGWLGFAVAAPGGELPHGVQVWLLPMLLVVGGIAGSLHYVVCLSHMFDVSKVFPETHPIFNPPMVNALVTAAWGVSSVIAWLMNIVHFATGASLGLMFGVLLGVNTFIMIGYAVIIDPVKVAGRPKVKLATSPAPGADSPPVGDPAPVEPPAKVVPRHAHPMVLIAALGVVLVLVYVAMGFYSNTQPEQFRWVAKGNSKQAAVLTSVAGVLIPLLTVTVFFVAPLISRPWATPRRQWFATAAVLVVWIALSVIRVPGLQYITIALFGFFRPSFYLVYYETARVYLPPAWFGRASMCGYTVAGITTVITGLWLNKYAISHQSYIAANLGLGLAAVVACIVVGVLTVKPLDIATPPEARALTIASPSLNESNEGTFILGNEKPSSLTAP